MARDLIFGWSQHLHASFIYARSEGSGKTVQIHRLSGVFTASLSYSSKPHVLTHIFQRTNKTNIINFVFCVGSLKWASMRENLSLGVCKQPRCRPAWVSAQSDQRLCYSNFGKYHILACYKRNFSFLASLCS